MENQPNSCWPLTAKVVVCIAVLMALAWLAGGPETSALLAQAG